MTSKIQKKLGVALAIGAILAGSAGSVALAAPERGDERKEAFRAKLLEKFDANKDGKLDDNERAAARAEKKAMREERRQQALAEFDGNKDGRLDEEERKAMHQKHREEAFKKLDTNGDGALSLAEFQAAPHHEGRGKFHGRRGQR